MNAAAMVLTLLLAAASQASPDIEVLGKGEATADVLEEIRTAARAARIELVAIEAIRSEIWSMLLGYGPPTQARKGICRGAVYGIDLKADSGAANTVVIPLDESSAMPMSYAIVAAECPRSLVSKILLSGKTTDDEFVAILGAIRERRAVKDGEDVRIAKELIVGVIQNPGDRTATVFMTDPDDEDNTLTVVLLKFGERWLISHTQSDP